MKQEVPATIRAAARVLKGQGSNLAVFVELHGWLDVEEFRSVPAWRIAQEMSIDECNVYRSIRALHSLHLIERGPKLGNAFTYRIANSTALAA